MSMLLSPDLAKVLLAVAALAFVIFFACMFAYHIESRSALSEQLRVIARGQEASQDAKDSLTKDASRLTSLAVAAGFFGVMSGLALFGSVYLHRYGAPRAAMFYHSSDYDETRRFSGRLARGAAAAPAPAKAGGSLDDLVPEGSAGASA